MMDKIKKLKQVLDIQCSHGNWDYDPYMQGMANGLICAMSILEGKEPEYKTAPVVWLRDINYPRPLDIQDLAQQDTEKTKE